jgi:hypothetical protein
MEVCTSSQATRRATSAAELASRNHPVEQLNGPEPCSRLVLITSDEPRRSCSGIGAPQRVFRRDEHREGR